MDDDDAFLAAMARELEMHDTPITLVLRPLTALQLAGLLQLALRHPNLSEAHRFVATTFIDHVRHAFAEAPATLELLRRGDNPALDEA